MGLLNWLFGTVATAGDIDGPGFFNVEVVGESNYQRAIQQAQKGERSIPVGLSRLVVAGRTRIGGECR